MDLYTLIVSILVGLIVNSIWAGLIHISKKVKNHSNANKSGFKGIN
ncbi:MAG: hypothetical protein E6342_18305 [Clostridium sp.]|nr:hypothetical protein [Clostridium sp.]MDU7089638.1 hypothetical protein [Clostridium sp.]